MRKVRDACAPSPVWFTASCELLPKPVQRTPETPSEGFARRRGRVDGVSRGLLVTVAVPREGDAVDLAVLITRTVGAERTWGLGDVCGVRPALGVWIVHTDHQEVAGVVGRAVAVVDLHGERSVSCRHQRVDQGRDDGRAHANPG